MIIMKVIYRKTKILLTLVLVQLVILSACAKALDSSSLAPYNLPKFRSVLDKSKLQYPESNTDIKYGEFKGVHRDYFYLSEEGFMTFETVRGQHNDIIRVELRQGPDEWKTSSSSLKRMVAELKLFYPEIIREYSWLQVHDSAASEPHINKPLIRLLWRKERKGKNDHIWAVIRTNNQAWGGSSALWVDLGKRPNGFFKAEIAIQNNLLTVNIEADVKLSKDVSYWQEFSNYFKAGIYLSGSANEGISANQKLVKVQFRSLFYQLE